MSDAAVPVGGQRTPKGLKPSDTNEATMYTAGKEFPVIVGMAVANNTGSAANATIRWGDGSTDYDIIATKSVAAHDTLFLPDIFLPLREGYTIKVTSGTGNALTFTLIIVSTGSTLPGGIGGAAA